MKCRKIHPPNIGLVGNGFQYDLVKDLITIGDRTMRFEQGMQRLFEMGAEGTIYKIVSLKAAVEKWAHGLLKVPGVVPS